EARTRQAAGWRVHVGAGACELTGEEERAREPHAGVGGDDEIAAAIAGRRGAVGQTPAPQQALPMAAFGDEQAGARVLPDVDARPRDREVARGERRRGGSGADAFARAA